MVNRDQQLILTLTLNPALDLFTHVGKLEPGTLHRTSGLEKNPGGKGINVAKMLRALDVPVLISGFLGGMNGDWIEAQLNADHIPTRVVRTEGETRLNMKVTSANEPLTELNSPSPPLKAEEWRRLDTLFDEIIQNKQWVTFCGNLPADCPPNWYQKKIERCHELGIQTAVDTSGQPLKYAIRAKPDLIKPNHEELKELTGKPLKQVSEIVRAACELSESGISTVAVTLGSGGLVVVSRGEAFVVTVPKVEVRSAVGAGDSVIAGFLYGFSCNLDVIETIRVASACGVAAVTKEGTTQPSWEDIVTYLDPIYIEKWEGER